MNDISVIIPAAGEGKRMGGNVSKQFLLLDGIPIFIHTIRAFEHCELVRRIVVVVPAQSVDGACEAVKKWRAAKVAAVIPGGVHRQDSVLYGYRALENPGSEIIMVHDAVRPFVSEELIRSVGESAFIHGAAIAAVRPTDTMKVSADGEFCEMTLKRSTLWSVQTPQAFRSEVFRDASLKAARDGFYGTDDAELVERIGVRVKIVPGYADNIKVTTPEDLETAERIYMRRKGAHRP